MSEEECSWGDKKSARAENGEVCENLTIWNVPQEPARKVITYNGSECIVHKMNANKEEYEGSRKCRCKQNTFSRLQRKKSE